MHVVNSRYPDVITIENSENLGFARANNIALKLMSGRYACLLNSDAMLTDTAIEAMVSLMDSDETIGVCGGQLLNEDGSRQNSISNIPTLLTELTNKSLLRKLMPSRYPGKEHVFESPVDVESVIGACMLVSKKAMDSVGLLNEDYFFFLEETDWCLRFRRAGYRVIHQPAARIFHFQGKSAGKRFIRARLEYWRSRYIFFQKHYSDAIWLVLVLGLLLRLLLTLTIYIPAAVFSLFMVKKIRLRFKLYLTLLAWHFMGLPAGWGLKPVSTPSYEKNV